MNMYKASLFSCLFSVVAMAQVMASDDLTFMGQEERISGGGVSAVTPLFPGLSRDMKNLILGKYLDGDDRLNLRVVSRDAKAMVDDFGCLKLKYTMTTEQIIEFFKRSNGVGKSMTNPDTNDGIG